jgi:hypothetical protein
MLLLQAELRELDLGGTVDDSCDAPNMLTGTIPEAWGSLTKLTQ